jgi:hypothetical protein
MIMKLEVLIGKFSAAVGIENVPAVEGVWKFSADGNVFGVTGDETGETVRLFGEVPYADPEKKDALLKAAMEANYFHRGTGGATFSLNPETGALTLIASTKLDALGEEDFFAFVEKFVNALATWKGISGSGESRDEPPADSPAGQAAPPNFGFMRV